MRTRQTHAGFSLIELLVGLTIGLVLLTVLATVFERTSGGRSDLDRVSRLVENSRFAIDSIGDDVRHAGFYGTFLPPSDTVFTDTSPCAWNVADLTLLGWRPALVPPQYPAQLMGWDDPVAGDPALGCLPDRVPGTDVIVIRRVSAETVAAAAVDVRNVYVQASQCINDPPPLLRVSNSAAQFTLRTAACNPGVIAPIRRYFVRGYYVASCNSCTPSDGVPTLKRVEIIDNAVRVVALAEGVVNLQIEYAFDTNNDGSPEQYLTSTTVGATPTSLWSNVVAVRMHILMRSTEGGPTQTSPAVYDLGPMHTAETCAAGSKCRLVSTTMRLNNVAGRREN